MFGQGIVLELMCKVRDRAAFVARGDVEEFHKAGRKTLYAQARIQKQRTEIGGGHQVLELLRRGPARSGLHHQDVGARGDRVGPLDVQ